MNPFGAFRFLHTVYRRGRLDRQRFGVSYLSQLKEIYALRRLNGLEPYEYFEYRLSDPALTWEEKKAYLSYNQGCALHRELSPLQDRAITTKFLSERFFDWFDIPMPRTYGIYDPRSGRTADGKSLKNAQEFREFIENLEANKFVLKPVSSGKGAGITVILWREGSVFISAAGKRLSPMQLWEKCLEGWKSTSSHTSYGLLIQEYVEQHEILQRIQPHSLNTLRVVTFINDGGEVEVLATMVKLGLGASTVDNLSKGGFAARVDEGGILQKAILEESGSYEPAEKHPTTNQQIEGVRLPFFDEAVALAIRAQLHIPQLRTLGWDIAITPKGPIIIETNVFWGNLTQVAICKGMITPGLREVLDRIAW
ncbi:MAG: hypothetical protein E4G91_07345 [Candidatus Zixiibacteriota bacterium]|nr:MAG: hypothetical protein E4G91_07345 [candidate division Zixibacteria bacterium]